MEQRKWLSWNDVERLAARLEDVQLERSRRTTYLPSELYKLKAPNWLRNQNHRLNQPSTQKNPCRNEVLQGRPAWVQTP